MLWLPFLCPAQGNHLNCTTSNCLAHNNLLYFSKFASNTVQAYTQANNLVPNRGLEKHKSMLLPIVITNFPPSAQFNCWTTTLFFPKPKSYYHSQDTGSTLTLLWRISFAHWPRATKKSSKHAEVTCVSAGQTDTYLWRPAAVLHSEKKQTRIKRTETQKNFLENKFPNKYLY